jgi:lytic murein transglycosylase
MTKSAAAGRFSNFSTRLGRFVLAAAFLSLPAARADAQPAPPQDFNAFVQGIWPDASKNGISRATFDNATAGLQPDAEVLGLTRRQPEYARPLGAYIGPMVSAARIAQGTKLAATWSDTLTGVEKAFGVDRFVILSIWGIETGFGNVPSNKDVFRSLATLAHARYRNDFFRNEFLAALRIVQDDHIPRQKMLGSWAGAMGQAQFIPSSFLKYAVDFSNDGRRDIWTNVPDVLGSIANYLAKSGWQRGVPWGFEVLIPPNFDYRRSRASFAEWKALGIRRADGKPLPEASDAVMLFPSGGDGPAFLVTGNYLAIKAYNNSDAYALAVAHLSDRMRGGGGIVTPWPANDQPLSRDDRKTLQRRLSQLGYKVNNFEGQIDFDLRDSIRDVQFKAGWRPDGQPTEKLLKHILAMPVARP